MDKNISVIFSTGDVCNLRCRYCYVRGENSDNFNDSNAIMSLGTVEKALILMKDINGDRNKYIHFSYHGGEPLILGPEFFKSCYSLQKKIFKGFFIDNSIQTNGVLLDDNYISLAKDLRFSYGISLDGPKDVNDTNRFGIYKNSVFDKIMKNLNMLQNNNIPFGILSVVTKELLGKQKELISFLIDNHIERIAFNPCVTDHLFTTFEYTITPYEYGKFLVDLFHEWTLVDNSTLIINNFFYPMRNIMGSTDNVCKFSDTCIGYTYTVYPDGDIYVCPCIKQDEYRLGNIIDSRSQLMSKEKELKRIAHISEECQSCLYYKLCYGGCIYERTVKHRDLQPRYYYCESYKMLFSAISGYINHYISTPSLSLEEVWNQR
ncbi:MAG: radical SAM protein [Candidatus Cloacimonetes bacterium]|nr:radical SAM protein [Candidatus Cloacimonadota bacterium]